MKAYKTFIEPVTCINGPVDKDKYLANMIIGDAFIGTRAFESIAEIDKVLNEMKNDPDLEQGCKEEGFEPVLRFEISEVKTPAERIAELGKDLKK